MSTPHYGTGTLQLNRGIDLPRSTMSLTADFPPDSTPGEVRLTLKDFLPGGCSMQITLSFEDAAKLASEINALAHRAAPCHPSESASDSPGICFALTA